MRENVLGSLHATQHLLSSVNLLHHTDGNVEQLNIKEGKISDWPGYRTEISHLVFSERIEDIPGTEED